MLDSLKLELQEVVNYSWVLGTELKAFARALMLLSRSLPSFLWDKISSVFPHTIGSQI